MEIKNVCVLGVGTIGYQIAQVAAQYGYSVTLRDIDDNLLKEGLKSIINNLDKFFVEKNKITQNEADKIISNIKITTDINEAVKDCDLVIEAIPEIISLKQDVFKELDQICPEHTIITSNTSALSLDDITLNIHRKDKVMATHFINPVQRMKLVELVISKHTSQDTLNKIKSFIASLGKETVLVKDSPGFVTTRLFVTLVNEGAKMYEEGIATAEDIDKAIVLGLNHPIGPLRAADINIETLVHCLRYLEKTLGKSYAPSPVLERLLAEGKKGVKTGQGFYKYTE